MTSTETQVFDPADYLGPSRGSVHLSGVRAVIRMLVEVLRADRDAGLRTAGFVAGYQGSPLAGFDRELQRALRGDLRVEIVHRPSVNEELAATAVMGSQLAGAMSSARIDGVVGLWYGKAPGLDRSVDALRHASYAGSHRSGGAVAVVGDDPDAKSSTLPSASEGILADLAMPVLFPKSLEEVVDLGHHAVALSRWSGAWTAIKLVTSVADAEGTAVLSERVRPVLPGGYTATPVSGDLLTPATLAREPAVLADRLDAAARYGDANELNRITVAPERPSLALAAPGTVYAELVEGLRLLGLDDRALLELGIRLAEIKMPYPLGAGFAAALGEGVSEVIVVEERRELVEDQLLRLLSRRPERVAVLGRTDSEGRPFFPRHGSLDARTIANRLEPLLRARAPERIRDRPGPRARIAVTAETQRVAWFCPGCPHSASTVVPEGTLLGEGIGCHSIVHYMPEDRVGRTVGITQMGGEGAQWIGMAPFVSDRHLVQNLGDGTLSHSGQLAIRASVAAGVSITYKVLWNQVTAMTGGQDIAGAFASPVDLARALLLEGVEQVVITTDDRSKYRGQRLPSGVSLRSREEILAVQEMLAGVEGVTVLIHDQACATELRRARKRGLAPTPEWRVTINERVCEGCGDCQTKSNCLSLQTVETPYGPKTRIDEETCNVDLACLAGDCPAFTLVRVTDRTPAAVAGGPGSPARTAPRTTGPRPAPAPVRALHSPMNVRLAGVGGTGVVTAAHLLAWAALHEGHEVWGLDQTGMAQKAGPVVSDLRIGPGASQRSNRIGAEETDLLLAADLITASTPALLGSLSPGRTVVVGSLASALTGPMLLGKAPRVPVDELRALVENAVGPESCTFVDAVELAVGLGAPATSANVVLLGVASQLGLLPVSATSIEKSIEANGIDVEANVAALRAGQEWAAGTDGGPGGPAIRPGEAGAATGEAGPAPTGEAGPGAREDSRLLPDAHRQRVLALADDLVSYQDRRLAERFLGLVAEAWEAERAAGGDGTFSAAVAFGYHKLLAYKDEYEVARLLLEHPAADGQTAWLLHPPLLRALGVKRKLRFGPASRPLLRALRRARGLRGRWLDPFGHSALRQEERRLAIDYAATVRTLFGGLSSASLAAAHRVAISPDLIRGYESVKATSIGRYREEVESGLDAFARARAAG